MVLLCFAACGFELAPAGMASDAAEADSIGDGAATDGAIDAMPPTLCAGTPRLDETFQGTAECAPWGTPYMTATSVVQGTGKLRIVPTSPNASGGCAEPQLNAWGGNGVIVEVPSVLTGATNYTVFQLLGLDRSMGMVNGALVYSNALGTTVFMLATYVPAQMRWWRMRPSTGMVVAEYSADAVTWMTFRAEPTTLGDMGVNLIAGTDGSPPSGAAEITRFVICQ